MCHDSGEGIYKLRSVARTCVTHESDRTSATSKKALMSDMIGYISLDSADSTLSASNDTCQNPSIVLAMIWQENAINDVESSGPASPALLQKF